MSPGAESAGSTPRLAWVGGYLEAPEEEAADRMRAGLPAGLMAAQIRAPSEGGLTGFGVPSSRFWFGAIVGVTYQFLGRGAWRAKKTLGGADHMSQAHGSGPKLCEGRPAAGFEKGVSTWAGLSARASLGHDSYAI